MRFLKHLSTTIIIPILFLPLLAGFVHADGFLIDFSPVTNAIGGVTSGISGVANQITNLPSSLWHFFTDSIKNSLVGFTQSLLDIEKAFVTRNPDPLAYQSLWSLVVGIISFFYLLVFFWVAFQFLITSNSEAKRVQAKESAEKAILMIVAVNCSLIFYGLLLSISSGVALALWDASMEGYFSGITISAGNILLIIVLLIGLLLSLITLFFRYLLLIAGFALVPIAAFLFFTSFSKEWGQLLFKLVMGAIVMQIIDSVLFSASLAVVHDLSGTMGIELLGPALGFIFIAVVNVLVLVFAASQVATPSIMLSTLSSNFVKMEGH